MKLTMCFRLGSDEVSMKSGVAALASPLRTCGSRCRGATIMCGLNVCGWRGVTLDEAEHRAVPGGNGLRRWCGSGFAT